MIEDEQRHVVLARTWKLGAEGRGEPLSERRFQCESRLAAIGKRDHQVAIRTIRGYSIVTPTGRDKKARTGKGKRGKRTKRVDVWRIPPSWSRRSVKAILNQLVETELGLCEREGGSKPRWNGPASESGIRVWEKRHQVTCPSSFRRLLHAHDGGSNVWGELCIVGSQKTSRSSRQLAREASFEIDADDNDGLDVVSSADFIPFATDRNGRLWGFSRTDKSARGELEVLYMKVPGFVDQRFRTFREFLAYCVLENRAALARANRRA